MKKFITAYLTIRNLLDDHLAKGKSKLQLERVSCNVSREIKQAIVDKSENMHAGNKVILIFKESINNIFMVEHHYCLDGKERILENEGSLTAPNKLCYFTLGKKNQIDSDELIRKPQEIEKFISDINDFYKRLKYLK